MSEKVPHEPVPSEIFTEMPGLILRHITTVTDDEQHLEYMHRNRDHLAEYGNTVDETVEAATQRRLESGDGQFGIWIENKFIGTVAYQTEHSDNEAAIGVSLDKDMTGRGYAAAAIKALTEYAVTRFERVYAEVDERNTSSIKMLNRAGYRTDGRVFELKWGRALIFEAIK
ncbi:MAG: GNAT family N-acetyltransferase [Candidatus Saccharimonadales bacterium]|jgi:RimJ/RimL family protein N-acetyltransferase